MYYLTTSSSGEQVVILLEGSLMTSMIENPESSDWQRYLEWLAAGNVPQPWEG